MSFFWYNLVPLTCLVAAVMMAMYDKPGWGWFLFVAVCLAAVPTSGKKSDKTSEEE